MNLKSTDSFTAAELYLLADAFGGNVLFGLPDKEIYQLRGEEVFEEGYLRLIDKKILTSEGKMTSGGAMIVRVLERYHQSEKYVRINNLMFAFTDPEAEDLILLVELENSEHYQLKILSKVHVLKVLTDHFPLILREPAENEKSFIKTELTHQERHMAENFETDMFMNLEFFHLNEEPCEVNNPRYYQQWLIFIKDDTLIMVDTILKKYYHTSQYWFLKVLFDELEFPYKGETVHA